MFSAMMSGSSQIDSTKKTCTEKKKQEKWFDEADFRLSQADIFIGQHGTL